MFDIDPPRTDDDIGVDHRELENDRRRTGTNSRDLRKLYAMKKEGIPETDRTREKELSRRRKRKRRRRRRRRKRSSSENS